jgi:hypothetical protein
MQQNTCQYTTSMMRSNVLGYSEIAFNSPTSSQTTLQTYGPVSLAITDIDSFYYYMKIEKTFVYVITSTAKNFFVYTMP